MSSNIFSAPNPVRPPATEGKSTIGFLCLQLSWRLLDLQPKSEMPDGCHNVSATRRQSVFGLQTVSEEGKLTPRSGDEMTRRRN